MPKNTDGVYFLPSEYLAVDGETVEPVQHNSPLEDIERELNELGTAAREGAGTFATAAQGKKADGALQSADYVDTSSGLEFDNDDGNPGVRYKDRGGGIQATFYSGMTPPKAPSEGSGWFGYYGIVDEGTGAGLIVEYATGNMFSTDGVSLTPLGSDGFAGLKDSSTEDQTQALRDALTAARDTGGFVLHPGGTIRITGQIDLSDSSRPICFVGAGSDNCEILMDYDDPGNAALDLSFSTDAKRVNGHTVKGIKFTGRGNNKTPDCIDLRNGTGFLVQDIRAEGSSVQGQLLRTSNNNNCRVGRLIAKSGFGRRVVEPGNITATTTAGSATATVSGATPSASWVGEYVLIKGAGDEDFTRTHFARITAVSGQNITISPAAESSNSGNQMVFDWPMVSMASGSDTMTVRNDASVFTDAAEWIGRWVTVPGARDIPAGGLHAGATKGSMTGRITAIVNSHTARLDFSATATATDEYMIVSPPVACYDLSHANGSSRRTNETFFSDVQIEEFRGGAGIVFEDAYAAGLVGGGNKLHASANSNQGFTPRLAFVSHSANVEIDAMLSFAGRPAIDGRPAVGLVDAQGLARGLTCSSLDVIGMVSGAPIIAARGSVASAFVEAASLLRSQETEGRQIIVADCPIARPRAIGGRDGPPVLSAGSMVLPNNAVSEIGLMGSYGVIELVSNNYNLDVGRYHYRTERDGRVGRLVGINNPTDAPIPDNSTSPNNPGTADASSGEVRLFVRGDRLVIVNRKFFGALAWNQTPVLA